jgi:hypothetical protein
MAGKGDKVRPYDKKKFDENFDQINWKGNTPELSKVKLDELLGEVKRVYKEKKDTGEKGV